MSRYLSKEHHSSRMVCNELFFVCFFNFIVARTQNEIYPLKFLNIQYIITHSRHRTVQQVSRAYSSRVCSVAPVVFNSETLWTVACHASLSMEFSRQEY